jgi:hypothetical protein
VRNGGRRKDWPGERGGREGVALRCLVLDLGWVVEAKGV